MTELVNNYDYQLVRNCISLTTLLEIQGLLFTHGKEKNLKRIEGKFTLVTT